MENNVDIQIDPILHRVCKLDAMSICKDVRRGEGRGLLKLFFCKLHHHNSCNIFID